LLIHLKAVAARRASHGTARSAPREALMLDLMLLAIGLGFFALSVGYTIACDRL
jgi:hypothetical protein